MLNQVCTITFGETILKVFGQYEVGWQNRPHFMKIPNAENAIIDIRKLRDYCLNPQHNKGKHKARLFSSIFGMNSNDVEALRNILLEAVRRHDAQLAEKDARGQRYTLDFTLKWQDKQATLRSGWIIETNSEIPKLTTAFPLIQKSN